MVQCAFLGMSLLTGELIAAKILLFTFCLLVVFHMLVMLGVISYKIVWGGRIKSKVQLYVMELLSILVLLLCVFLLSLKLGIFVFKGSDFIVSIGLWSLLGIFVLNTFGNLMAKTKLEKYLFGSLTFMISVLLLCVIFNFF